MKKAGRFFSLLCSLIFIGQSSFAQFNGMEQSLKSTGSADQSKIISTLLISFVIGNVVAWSMGAYPKTFDMAPYTPGESETIDDLTNEIRENPGESDIKTELGTIYFQHNDLDKAKEVLQKAVKQNPADAEALAVYSANEAKQAGAMWDFTWGIMKLNRLGDAVDGLNRAVEIDPDNFNVRLYRMNTLASLENRENSFFRVFEDEQWFKAKNERDPNYFPAGVKLSFYRALAEAYEVRETLEPDKNKPGIHLKQAEAYRKLSMGIKKNENQ